MGRVNQFLKERTTATNGDLGRLVVGLDGDGVLVAGALEDLAEGGLGGVREGVGGEGSVGDGMQEELTDSFLCFSSCAVWMIIR